jgi:hypothetical protein
MSRVSVTTKNFTPIGSEDEVGLDNDPMYHITRVFVYFLQNLFRDFPEGCGMKWNPNEETSEIVITGEKPMLEAIEKRPHITCVLGAGRFSGLGLDQLQTQRASDGQRTHTDLMPMSIGYHCQAKPSEHPRRIAWNALYYTVILRRIIMRVGGLFQVGNTPSMGPEGDITQFTGPSVDTPLVEVPVVVPFYWQPQWRISRPSEVWRRMVMTMNVNPAQPHYSAGRAMKLRPPMVKGVPVQTRPLAPAPAQPYQTVEESQYFEEEE